jgi:hypothetical protein
MRRLLTPLLLSMSITSAAAQGSRPATLLDPQDELREAYARYIAVKRCYEVRRGYARVHVTERQMAQAREVARRLEGRLRTPEMDLDILWLQANEMADGVVRVDADISSCGWVLGDFEAKYPALFREVLQENKDF